MARSRPAFNFTKNFWGGETALCVRGGAKTAYPLLSDQMKKGLLFLADGLDRGVVRGAASLEPDAELLAHGAEKETVEAALVAVDACRVAEFSVGEDTRGVGVRKGELGSSESLKLFSILLGLLGLSGFTGVATLVIQAARREVHVPTDAHHLMERRGVIERRVLGGFLGEDRIEGGLKIGSVCGVALHSGEGWRAGCDLVLVRK